MTQRCGAYLMENAEENIRLETKTDPAAVVRQARWCGITPGFRVMDAGCGPGFTTSLLFEQIQPGGEIVGVDYAHARIDYARERYGHVPGMRFLLHDLREPLAGAGLFDLIWVRFVLEYNRRESPAIVRNLMHCLKPGGLLCLLDLDNNCLNHYALPAPIERTLREIMEVLGRDFNFDPFAGRKLYSYLYDLGFEDIEMDLVAHHLFYGDNMREEDKFNWAKKFEVAIPKESGLFDAYPGGAAAFREDFARFFRDPRRFTYTPLIMCKGKKPRAD